MRDWQATLFDHGWMIPGYPPELGGRNCTPVQTLIYLETLVEPAPAPQSGHFPGYAIVAPSLLEFGNDEQKKLAPGAIRGDTIWCIGMSEPNAGSDLAGLQTRAEVYDDHFVVNGQKVWTSYAMIAQKCFCYVRTDPTLPKHKGISLLIIDVDSPGIDIRPLRHINGTAGFAEVFFTDVIVPRENLVGGLNGGWAITQGSLAHERAGLWVEGVARFEQTIEGLVELAREARPRRRPDHPPQDRAVPRARVDLRALGYKGFASFAEGSSAPEHSYMKMATSEAGKAAYELGMEIAGTARAGHRRARRRDRPLVARLLHVVREHDRGRQLRDPAQHHRPARAGAPEALRSAMDFSLTADQQLLRDTGPSCSSASARRPRARAHRRPVGVRAAVAPPPEYRPSAPVRPPTSACSSRDRLRRRARTVPRHRDVHRTHRRRRDARARSCSVDDPTPRSCSKPTASSDRGRGSGPVARRRRR